MPSQPRLSTRTTRCLVNAGIAIEKKSIIRALKDGKLYPYHWPPNYGKYTHAEVCRWAGADPTALPQTWPVQANTLHPNNGLSYRANRCLSRSGISATKKAVRDALRTGKLLPGKRPSNYGSQTHAELCRWTGIDPRSL